MARRTTPLPKETADALASLASIFGDAVIAELRGIPPKKRDKKTPRIKRDSK